MGREKDGAQLAGGEKVVTFSEVWLNYQPETLLLLCKAGVGSVLRKTRSWEMNAVLIR